MRDWIAVRVGEATGSSETSLRTKCASAVITGVGGSILGNPADVLKVRMQVDSSRYPSPLSGFSRILRYEGAGTLFTKGLVPSLGRGAVIGIAGVVTYDQTKSTMKSHGLGEEGFRLHATCSAITGLVSATAAAPCDLIKTRCMNAPGGLSAVRCLSLAIKEGGLIGLFRGWMPSYCRLGPHSLIQFPLLEQIRLLLGLGHF